MAVPANSSRSAAERWRRLSRWLGRNGGNAMGLPLAIESPLAMELDVELAVKRAVTAVLAPCGLEAVKAPLGPESAWGCCSSSS